MRYSNGSSGLLLADWERSQATGGEGMRAHLTFPPKWERIGEKRWKQRVARWGGNLDCRSGEVILRSVADDRTPALLRDGLAREAGQTFLSSTTDQDVRP